MKTNKIGQLIKEARIKRGLKQSELAKMIILQTGNSMSMQYLSDIERGYHQCSNPYNLNQFAKVLKLDCEYLHYLCGLFFLENKYKDLSLEDFKARMAKFKK